MYKLAQKRKNPQRSKAARQQTQAGVVQKKTDAARRQPGSGDMGKVNRTGLPDRIKTGMEHLSGLSMDDVRVHYNSPKPHQVHAHAYTQGSEIYMAPGQERHLPHEAWHVVQQKQGRVKPTQMLKSANEKVSINADQRLEREADTMARRVNHSNEQVRAANPVSYVSAQSGMRSGGGNGLTGLGQPVQCLGKQSQSSMSVIQRETKGNEKMIQEKKEKYQIDMMKLVSYYLDNMSEKEFNQGVYKSKMFNEKIKQNEKKEVAEKEELEKVKKESLKQYKEEKEQEEKYNDEINQAFVESLGMKARKRKGAVDASRIRRNAINSQ